MGPPLESNPYRSKTRERRALTALTGTSRHVGVTGTSLALAHASRSRPRSGMNSMTSARPGAQIHLRHTLCSVAAVGSAAQPYQLSFEEGGFDLFRAVPSEPPPRVDPPASTVSVLLGRKHKEGGPPSRPRSTRPLGPWDIRPPT